MMIFHLKGWDMLFMHIPGWLILVIGGIIVLGLALYYITRLPKLDAAVRFSDLGLLKSGGATIRSRARSFLPVFRLLAVGFMIFALARPQSGTSKREIDSEGIDIVMALDVSLSMKARDFQPHNRLYVAKEEISKFIDRRTNDRIGLVVFGGISFTQCPLTLDYNVLKTFLAQVDFNMVPDGTAIGMGLINAINRLRDSEAKSKIIVLLTDGNNNAGEIDPLVAASVAKKMGIKVYTIGAGKPGNVLRSSGLAVRYQPNELNEDLLKQIATETGGRYFRARSEGELNQIYSEIDQLEKTKIKVKEYTQYRDLFFNYMLAGFGLLLVEIVLGQTFLKKLP